MTQKSESQKSESQKSGAQESGRGRLDGAILGLTLTILAAVPLAFWTPAYRSFVTPKSCSLFIGAAILLPLITFALLEPGRRGTERRSLFKGGYFIALMAFAAMAAVSAATGTAPRVSILGSFDVGMGLLSYLSFVTVFVGLVIGVGTSASRFRILMWVIALTGLLVAAYGAAQAAGMDPFVLSSSYSFPSAAGGVMRRPPSTMGHPDYLGSFLLYTTPLSIALAVISKGSARRIAAAAALLSVAAILASGTRAAWLGLAVVAVMLAALYGRRARGKNVSWKTLALRAGLPLAALGGVAIWAVLFSQVGQAVAGRTKATFAEGMTGAGRTLLWRDALKMVRESPVLGRGPGTFRKAFLPYRSDELAHWSPTQLPESSHNYYLDAAISFGLPGAAVLGLLMVQALAMMYRASRALDDSRAILAGACLAGLVAILVDKFFIYDQVSTGLYFFAFLAIALAARNSTEASLGTKEGQNGEIEAASNRRGPPRWLGPAAAVIALTGVPAAIWYSANQMAGDMNVTQALGCAHAGNFDCLMEHRRKALAVADPIGGFRFLIVRALADYAGAATSPENQDSRSAAVKAGIEDLAPFAGRGVSPDADYALLSLLSIESEDFARGETYARQALDWAPKIPQNHALLATSLLAQGRVQEAIPEFSAAHYFAIRPGRGPSTKRIKIKINSGLALLEKGQILKAEIQLVGAMVHARGPCPECHCALAKVFEKAGLQEQAEQERRQCGP